MSKPLTTKSKRAVKLKLLVWVDNEVVAELYLNKQPFHASVSFVERMEFKQNSSVKRRAA